LALPSLKVATEPEQTVALDAEVVEITFLLPAGQAVALERAACQRDLTLAQMARRLIRDFLNHAPCHLPTRED
jgi:hypothetical protein